MFLCLLKVFFLISRRIHTLYQLASSLHIKIVSSFKVQLKSHLLQEVFTKPLLVIYCCATKCPKLSGLKQQSIRIFQSSVGDLSCGWGSSHLNAWPGRTFQMAQSHSWKLVGEELGRGS